MHHQLLLLILKFSIFLTLITVRVILGHSLLSLCEFHWFEGESLLHLYGRECAAQGLQIRKSVRSGGSDWKTTKSWVVFKTYYFPPSFNRYFLSRTASICTRIYMWNGDANIVTTTRLAVNKFAANYKEQQKGREVRKRVRLMRSVYPAFSSVSRHLILFSCLPLSDAFLDYKQR